MKFDRIVIDFLDWIRRVFWHDAKKLEKPPYVSLKITEWDTGVLKLVVGRDTPRAIRTYIFEPTRKLSPNIYFCLDTLDYVAGEDRVKNKTHRFQILATSRFMTTEGFYTSESLFCEDFDCIGASGNVNPNIVARVILDKLVINLKYQQYFDIDWGYEIELQRTSLLGLEKPAKKIRPNLVSGRILKAWIGYVLLSILNGSQRS